MFLLTFWTLLISVCIADRILPPQLSILSTDDFPSDERLRPMIANGYLGLAIAGDTMYVGGVFNGVTAKETGDTLSHRARIPSTASISFTTDDSSGAFHDFALDLEYGIYSQKWNSDSVSVVQSIYAHHTYRNLIVTQLDIDNSGNTNDLSLKLSNAMGNMASDDMSFNTVDCPVTDPSIVCYKGVTFEAELGLDVTTVYLVTTSMSNDNTNPTVVDIAAGDAKSVFFLTVIVSTLEESIDDLPKATLSLYDQYFSQTSDLMADHIAEWSKIWKMGRIDISAEQPSIARDTYASLFYIFSSIRGDWHYGLSPGSIASDAYNGHVFWDQETWMYPVCLMLHKGLAKSALQYRADRLEGAKTNAQKTGYKGARFPWESAVSGIEVCPSWAPEGDREIHITGDIAFALRQYWYVSGDEQWLKDVAFPMITAMCDFWISWATYDASTQAWHINGVIPPDEYQDKIDDSVYTNYVAKVTLEFGIELSSRFNGYVPAYWQSFVDGITILFDDSLQYHPEYSGYDPSVTVKQADVVLLGFPLMMNMSRSIRSNDLSIYEPVTDPNGPAMTWAMFSVGWAELGDYTQADKFFADDYYNIQQPFNIWTEVKDGSGAVNFITGAGGYLQSLMFGYGGIRLNGDGLTVNTQYIPCDNMTLVGLEYLGNEISLEINAKAKYWIQLQLMESHTNSSAISVTNAANQTSKLTLNVPLTFAVTDQPLLVTKL